MQLAGAGKPAAQGRLDMLASLSPLALVNLESLDPHETPKNPGKSLSSRLLSCCAMSDRAQLPIPTVAVLQLCVRLTIRSIKTTTKAVLSSRYSETKSRASGGDIAHFAFYLTGCMRPRKPE